MNTCEKCGYEDVHVVPIAELEPIKITIPYHQKVTLLNEDGEQILSVMNQCGDMIVWLEKKALVDIIDDVIDKDTKKEVSKPNTLIYDLRINTLGALMDNSESMIDVTEETDGFTFEQYEKLTEDLHSILSRSDNPCDDYSTRLRDTPTKLREYISDQIDYYMTEGFMDEAVLDERGLI
jgi:hypothetical protein